MATTERAVKRGATARRGLHRLAWFVVFWIVGVTSLAVVAWLIRSALGG